MILFLIYYTLKLGSLRKKRRFYFPGGSSAFSEDEEMTRMAQILGQKFWGEAWTMETTGCCKVGPPIYSSCKYMRARLSMFWHFVTLKYFYLNVPKRSNIGCVAKGLFLDYRHLVEYIRLCAIYSPYTARSPHATVVPHSSLSLGTCLSPYQGC